MEITTQMIKELRAATKAPMAGATVYAQGGDSQGASRTTDATGKAQLRLFPGQYQVQAYKDGYRRPEPGNAVEVELGKTRSLELALKGAEKIVGTVQDAAGTPVKGAAVQILPGFGGRDVRTDETGKFEATWDPPRPGAATRSHSGWW